MSDSYKELEREYLMRDGISQKQRTSKALSPGYVSVDERTAEDMFQFIQKFSKKLKFYDLDGTVTDWSSFLTSHPYNNEDERAYAEVIDKRIKEIASYLEKESFPSDANLLARPHLALLLCFIKLLGHTRKQINTITKRHLDFYYTEALGLKNKKAVPDKVNVIVKLVNEAKQLLLPAGTKLDAGNDTSGKPLVYATDKEMVLNQAKIGAIKSLYVEKQITGIRDIHFRIDNPDEAFIQILQLILADPSPNDHLPLFPDGQEVNIAFIQGLKNLKKDLAWIDTNLYMSFYDFSLIMQINTSNAESNDQWDTVHSIIEAAGRRKRNGASFIIKERTSNKTFDANVNNAVGPISFNGIAGVKSLNDFYTKRIKQIEDYFCLLALEVAILMDVQATIKPPDVRHPSINEWNQAYELLEAAYRNKAQKYRINQLRNQKEKEGFEAMFTKALGTINPGETQPVLLYSLDELYQGQEDARKQEYIVSELYLEKKDFNTIMNAHSNAAATGVEWNKAYSLIEKAQRKKNKLLDLPPQREEIFNIYKAEDATKLTSLEVYQDKNTKSSWPLFGITQGGKAINAMTPAEIGFAISSPVLLLTQGLRTITATLDFHSEGFDSKGLEGILSKEPFLFYLLDKNGSLQLKANAVRIGVIVAGMFEQDYTGATLNAAKDTITLGKDSLFGSDDLNKWIVWNDGDIFKITDVFPDKTKVRVIRAGSAGAHTGVKKYEQSGIYFNALQIEFILAEKDRAIEASSDDEAGFTQWPTLKLVLNNIPGSNPERSSIYYQVFKQLQIKEVHLGVKVANMKSFSCQSDESEITPTKPFEPFGATPYSGSGFYFGHQEIAMKKLDNLSLSFDWMGVPDNLQDFYKNYYSDNNPITSNAVFLADVKLNDRSFTVSLGNVNLFAGDKKDAQKVNEVTISNIPKQVRTSYPNYSYETEANIEEDKDDLLDWDKYFKLELNSPDFQHARYSAAAFEKSMKLSGDLNADPKKTINMADYTVNPPYTPKLKSLNLSYAASAVILADANTTGLFHVHPFGDGTLPKEEDNTCFFLPQYNEEGVLYIGLEEAVPPQEISMLFQLAESSSNPDIEKPEVSWSYLIDNQWRSFDDKSIVSDETNGLSNTGNMIFKLPENLNNNNALLEKGKYWIKASVPKNAEGVCKAIALHTQTVSATFMDQDNAPDHLLNPLPPDSISVTTSDFPDIESIAQPYTSMQGSTKELDEHFSRRVSERLRHKNRGLTVWDYEHIVLENFPDIYKVKCMPATTLKDAGSITLVLIPDIINKLPANPFEPKVPSNRLEEVKRYLEKYTSPYVSLVVKNPKYMVVKVRVGVAFKSGSEGYYKELLNKELQKFLAPWAYSEGADIVLGGKIYANNIVNFIETRDYINYVSHIKLFSSIDGINFTQVIVSDKEPENAVSALEPDVILVSSKQHEIDVIENNNYSDSNFSGIEYMKVELDFRVE